MSLSLKSRRRAKNSKGHAFVTSKIKKALNIHHFRVVNRFAHLNEVKISDIERF
ncbi:MAG: hypothetical protein ACI89W_000556, partial [Gammaproteobacteria bacterium]